MNLLRTTSMRLLVQVIIGLMPGLVLAAGPVGQGSGAVEPIVVLDQSGVEVTVVGSTTMQLDPAGGANLTLEQITLAEGATFGPVTATGSELIVMVDGALQQQDERGFWARMDAPYQIVVAPGDQVSWTASVETSLLRLRLTDATPETATFDGVEIVRAAQFRLDSLPEEPALVFIAQASLSGRGDGGRLEHDGTVGIAVESGAVDVLSPSGLEGRLGEGQTALYRDGAPIEFLGTSDDAPASALLIGVSTTARTLEAGTNAESSVVTTPQTANVSATSDELVAMLPASDALPITGLTSVEDSSLTEAEVVGALGGGRDAETKLNTWGWSGNATRSYLAPDPSVMDPSATTNITISLHGFGSDGAAAEALVFYSDVLINIGYQEVEVGDIGATNRMLAQPQQDGGMQVALYAQRGPILYRVGGYSPAGDPTDNVIKIAEQLLVQ